MTSTDIAEIIVTILEPDSQEPIKDLLQHYKVSLLEEVKFGFDICSDNSTNCLGYRNLVDRIRREKANEPIAEFPTLHSV